MISAATDFSLCIRRASSCSKHADCARAQFGSRNPQRQAFVAPTITGDACAYFYPFSPFRPLAENGGGIADALAESENRGRSEQSGAASRENAGESGSAFTFEAAAQQERSDKTNSSATNATPRPASTLSRALGPRGRLGFAHEPAGVPSASAGLSQAQLEQLHAARALNL